MNKIKYRLEYCPLLQKNFSEWIIKYTDIDKGQREKKRFINKVVYDISKERDYDRAVIDCIASMTDEFVLRVFAELTRFR